MFEQYEKEIEALSIVPSDGGRFEVSLDGELIYSKLEKGRHPEEGEVLKLIGEKVEA